jgi:phospholipase/lecithinase/hemolysin
MQEPRWHHLILRLFFIMLLGLFSLPSFAITIDKIVVFGDSLSDNGNISHLLKGKIPRNPPYFSGRFSDGETWVERVARDMHLNPESPDQFSDHAFAGAWGSDENNSDPLSYFTLSSEIDDFLSYESTHGASNANHLFVIWIGNNDYLAGDVSLDIDTAATKTVNAIMSGMDALIADGARNFLILNITDLGQTPSSVDSGKDTIKRRTELSLAHNKKLAAALQRMRETQHVNIVELDLMPYFQELVAHPERHALKNVDTPCYDGDYGDFDTLDTKTTLKNSKYNIKHNSLLKEAYYKHPRKSATAWHVCKNPNEYIYFDHLHPTGYVHQLLGDYALAILKQHGVHGPGQ